MGSSTLSGADTADHPRSILDGLLRVESSLLSGESLTNHLRIFCELQVLAGGIVAGEPHAELAQLKSVWRKSTKEKKKLKIKKEKKSCDGALEVNGGLMCERFE